MFYPLLYIVPSFRKLNIKFYNTRVFAKIYGIFATNANFTFNSRQVCKCLKVIIFTITMLFKLFRYIFYSLRYRIWKRTQTQDKSNACINSENTLNTGQCLLKWRVRNFRKGKDITEIKPFFWTQLVGLFRLQIL